MINNEKLRIFLLTELEICHHDLLSSVLKILNLAVIQKKNAIFIKEGRKGRKQPPEEQRKG